MMASTTGSAAAGLLTVLVLCSAVLGSAGLRCYQCSGCEEGERGYPVLCNSKQNACIKLVLGTRIEKACSPNAACSLASIEKSFRNMFQGLGSAITGNQQDTSKDAQVIHCCDTDYCNAGTAVSPATLLLLLTPLLLTVLLR